MAEGRINERQYEAIQETASLLDKRRREFEDAVARGVSRRDIEKIRDVHERELAASEAKEQ